MDWVLLHRGAKQFVCPLKHNREWASWGHSAEDGISLIPLLVAFGRGRNGHLGITQAIGGSTGTSRPTRSRFGRRGFLKNSEQSVKG